MSDVSDPMNIFRVFLLCIALLPCAARAQNTEEIATRFGTVEVVPSSTSDNYDLLLDKRRLLSTGALWIALYRVSPKGKNEYVVVESRVPGVTCLREFRVLELVSKGQHFLSGVFGECTDLKAVRHTLRG